MSSSLYLYQDNLYYLSGNQGWAPSNSADVNESPKVGGSSNSGSPPTSCVSQGEISQASEGSRTSGLGCVKTTAMKKGGNGSGGTVAGMGGMPKKMSGSLPGASQQASLVASLQAEAVRQQQVVSTTFVEADTSSFRELVQKLTGVSEDSQEKLPITLPSRHVSRETSGQRDSFNMLNNHRDSSGMTWEIPRDASTVYSHLQSREMMMPTGNHQEFRQGMSQRDVTNMMFDDRGFGRNPMSQEAFANWEKLIAGRNLPGGLNNVDPYRIVSNVEPLAVRRSAFKLHDRKPLGKKLELKQGAILRRDGGGNSLFPGGWTGHPVLSPRSEIEHSPVTPLTRDPFDSHLYSPATPTSYETSSGATASAQMGPEGCSPSTAVSGYNSCLNIIQHLESRGKSALQDVAKEPPSCNMGLMANESRCLAEAEREYVLHPPLERRNGEPQLLTLFPLHSSHASEKS